MTNIADKKGILATVRPESLGSMREVREGKSTGSFVIEDIFHGVETLLFRRECRSYVVCERRP